MVKYFLLCLSAVILTAGTIEIPIPLEYQHGARIVVHMLDTQAEIDAICEPAPKGMRKLGCETAVDSDEIVTGNPCNYPEASDVNSYAHLVCHEKAHVNGWSHEAP